MYIRITKDLQGFLLFRVKASGFTVAVAVEVSFFRQLERH